MAIMVFFSTSKAYLQLATQPNVTINEEAIHMYKGVVNAGENK